MFNVDNTYLTKQHQRYNTATGAAALDPLWRAASAAGLLHRNETSQDQFTPARVTELLHQLGWSQREY